MHNVVAITTVRQGSSDNPIERVRAGVFLDTLCELVRRDIPCVAVYVGCSAAYLAQLKKGGAVLVPQTTRGMGNIRREALRAGLRAFPAAPYYLWMEPEKPDLPQFVERMVGLMRKTKTNLGLFNRISMESYPEEQAHYYAFCRAVASKLLGVDIDYAFGPMVMSKRGMTPFLRYRGRYGDRWDSILIPRLRVLKEGGRVALLRTNFRNDSRMTSVESGRPAMILKRLEQFNNVIPSLIREWRRLGA